MPTTTDLPTTTDDHAPAIFPLAHRDRRRTIADRDEPEGQYLMFRGSCGVRLLPLGDGVVRVGRGLSSDVTLEDPTVSRRHATLMRTAGVVRLCDDCSANGTWVNGRRTRDVELVDGDVVAFGGVVVVFRDTRPVSGPGRPTPHPRCTVARCLSGIAA